MVLLLASSPFSSLPDADGVSRNVYSESLGLLLLPSILTAGQLHAPPQAARSISAVHFSPLALTLIGNGSPIVKC
jgi:hypothetical protein